MDGIVQTGDSVREDDDEEFVFSVRKPIYFPLIDKHGSDGATNSNASISTEMGGRRREIYDEDTVPPPANLRIDYVGGELGDSEENIRLPSFVFGRLPYEIPQLKNNPFETLSMSNFPDT